MKRDRDSIYEMLTERITRHTENRLTPEQCVTLDGELWAIADLLSDERAETDYKT